MNSNNTTIPFLSLYRNILRAHQKYLPYEMKQIGDTYIKTEFRLHNDKKKIPKPEQLKQFMYEWNEYLQQISITGRAQELSRVSDSIIDKSVSHHLNNHSIHHHDIVIDEQQQSKQHEIFLFGKDLPSDIQLSETQIQQLEKLKEEAFKRK